MRRNLLAVLLALAAGCGPAERHAHSQQPAALVERGREVYNFRCYYCHGYSGDARTLAATFLSPPPRDFTDPGAATRLTREYMTVIARDGRPGTAMAAFGSRLTEGELHAVVAFVRDEFIARRAENTRYHTAENGWPGHERYRAAFPFATGEIAIDTPPQVLDGEQRAGQRLFMNACVSCHDRSRVSEAGVTWAAASAPGSAP